MKAKRLLFSLIATGIIFTVSAQTGNTLLGSDAGGHIQDGEYNTYLGASSGDINYDGSYNVFLGSFAGYESNNGHSNTYIGSYSGHIATGSYNVFIGKYAGYNETGNHKLYIDNTPSSTPLIWGDFSYNKLIFNGKVGITNETLANQANLFPTTSGSVDVSAYQLFVKGGILTEAVRVQLKSDWADYVFKEEYNLPSLEEVECYISENGHLPNVPSAAAVKENGIELGEIAKMQQEKIEELTLYIIDQNKQIKKQQKEIDELRTVVQQLVEKKQGKL